MSNRLKGESSPYLKDHAENPVDWYPWCREAFDKAKREDKPVFLSIGYSTCHWCHVMAHESFEDETVAAILNRSFVPVKVDREERPDIDSVYMSVCTALNGSGGWPLTVIMTPEQVPFFAGTYIPKNNQGNRIGLVSLLTAIAEKWRRERKDLLRAGNEILKYISAAPKPGKAVAGEGFLKRAAFQLADSYDEEYGGFGTAPKFPSPHNLLFLLRYAKMSGDKQARDQVENTLRQMYRGGIFDHIGGGFARYSTDREWLAPHFEKTLYDNALLALAYTEAWRDGHMALYRTVAESVLDYCLRELQSEDGGFFCGQDADSDGKEGAYYLFTPGEIKQVLGEDDGRHFCECYDVTEEGNFEGKSILNLLLNNRWSFVPEGYDEFREKLRLYREQRMELRTDTKQLCSWNALMLSALSSAASAFGDRRYLSAARELADFMAAAFGTADALKSCRTDGKTKFAAQLDDYVFYALGLLDLYGADFDPAHIALAASLAERVLHSFRDADGGFFRTADDAEKLILRPRETYDGAFPSGNSGAAVLFDRLWRLTADVKWREERDRQTEYLCAFSGNYPAGCTFGLTALLSSVYPTRELVCVSPDEKVPELFRSVTGKYAPELTAILKTPSNAGALAASCPFTAEYETKDGKATFYICSDGACTAPFTE